MTGAILSMDAVSLSFKDKRVLDNLTFSIPRGQTFGFLGPSGAGKTTTIKLLTRQLAKDAGRISLLGRPIERASAADYERIGILSDTSALYDRMSIADNLRFYARLRGVSHGRVPYLLERMGLTDSAKTLIKNCSKGMRQRAALAASLVHQPELLFLDEPTSGLDPAARAEVHKMLGELRDRGTTVFLTTHDMAEAEAVCDRVAILNDGAIVACDDPEELKLRYARNRVVIRTRTRGTFEVAKDAAGADLIDDLMRAGELVSIHSDEPNLEEVFLEVTGREF
ncbi:ABC transporter ATP-binding protein [Adlercreutzia faecimuris]|uniref:ABC transporter ATP-binding protein n=1 Tax=Adlercreutzia faecimuris TaxID=2897341 RepID=A0ABS9WJ05_9ACTN|nr:ABC transporter ATP-binding protein [Adlercreutzia sp. JBNU-10]MCI2242858.1 ABC transporter ATP-binding protein [Adlercreutzia sp. JBNU-10]